MNHRLPDLACRLCGHALAEAMLDLGELPPCNRYSATDPTQDRHRLRVTQCAACGLIQLAEDTPIDFVRPRVSWIRYNEPDGHLGDLASRLVARVGGDAPSALGVGPFDRPLLNALAEHRVRTATVDLLPPTAAETGEYPYLETLQHCLRPEPLGHAAEQHGTADIVLCRYLLEHSHAPIDSLRGLRRLLAGDGCVVIEVPDSSKFIRRRDYSFIWEEHICYFVEETLRALAAPAGFRVDAVLRYEGLLEDALVAILRPDINDAAEIAASPTKQQPGDLAFAGYRNAFVGIRGIYQDRLAALTAGGGKVALIGMGHQAVMFVNALGLQHHIALMVDDDPNKQGCFVPGTATRVVPSAALLDSGGVSACLLAVHPRVEPKVRDRLRPLLEQGVPFYSLFTGGNGRTILDEVA